MTSDPESPQRIARLTPLGEVLARVDALVEPVAPRQVEFRHGGGPRGCGRHAGGAPSPRAAGVARRLGGELRTSRPMPAPMRRLCSPPRRGSTWGSPLPVGADAVAPLDVVVRRHGQIEIIASVGAGEGVLPMGADADRRRSLVREGRRLTPIQAAVLAARPGWSICTSVSRACALCAAGQRATP